MNKIFFVLVAGLVFFAACGGAQVQTRTNATDGKVMVHVPAGEFKIGLTPEQEQTLVSRYNVAASGLNFEKPDHTVNVAEFWIDRDLVTNAEYKKFLDANPSHPVPDTEVVQLKGWSWDAGTRAFPPGRDNFPVVLVSYDDAVAYCQWAGNRLPTEAEWEKAARGTDGRMYPWGNEWGSDKTAYGEKGAADASAVNTHPAGASAYGVNDMVGNVWQWTSSAFVNYPYQAGDGREDQTKVVDRVTRGGMFAFGPGVSRANVRNHLAPTDRAISVGIRCAGN